MSHCIPQTGNVLPLLHEIRHALGRIVEGGDGTTIDLQRLPLAPGEERLIEEALGAGEVHITLDALGPSTIRETAYPGVWLVTHRNVEEEVVGRYVEITPLPDIVAARFEDICDGLAKLGEDLALGAEQSGET